MSVKLAENQPLGLRENHACSRRSSKGFEEILNSGPWSLRCYTRRSGAYKNREARISITSHTGYARRSPAGVRSRDRPRLQMHRKPRLTDPGAKSHCLHYSAGGATNGSILGVKKEIPG